MFCPRLISIPISKRNIFFGCITSSERKPKLQISQTAQGLDPLAGKIRPGRGKTDEQIAGGPYMNTFEKASKIGNWGQNKSFERS